MGLLQQRCDRFEPRICLIRDICKVCYYACKTCMCRCKGRMDVRSKVLKREKVSCCTCNVEKWLRSIGKREMERSYHDCAQSAMFSKRRHLWNDERDDVTGLDPKGRHQRLEVVVGARQLQRNSVRLSQQQQCNVMHTHACRCWCFTNFVVKTKSWSASVEQRKTKSIIISCARSTIEGVFF